MAQAKKILLIFLILLLIALASLSLVYQIDWLELMQTPQTLIAQTLPEENEPTGDEYELSILTFNTWGLPHPVTSYLGKRVELITESIREYDIVNLQETFSRYTSAIATDSGFPNYVRYDNRSLLSFGSGLTSLSKHPIIEYDYKEFSSCLSFDCWANKGILFTRIQLPGVGPIDVYNTHYQASQYGSEFVDIRLSDNQDLYEFYQKHNEGYLTIISGDFNFLETSEEYKNFVSKFSPVDTFRQINPDLPGFTYDDKANDLIQDSSVRGRIDYIFFLPPTVDTNYTVELVDSNIVFTEKLDGVFPSDHFGVVTTLKFRKK